MGAAVAASGLSQRIPAWVPGETCGQGVFSSYWKLFRPKLRLCVCVRVRVCVCVCVRARACALFPSPPSRAPAHWCFPACLSGLPWGCTSVLLSWGRLTSPRSGSPEAPTQPKWKKKVFQGILRDHAPWGSQVPHQRPQLSGTSEPAVKVKKPAQEGDLLLPLCARHPCQGQIVVERGKAQRTQILEISSLSPQTLETN